MLKLATFNSQFDLVAPITSNITTHNCLYGKHTHKQSTVGYVCACNICVYSCGRTATTF